MENRLRRWTLLFALLPGALAQTTTETQHGFDVTVPLRPRLDVLLHSRFRTQPAGLGLYQFRSGPILDYTLSDRVSLLAGYYFSYQEEDDDLRGRHRWFGGGEVSLGRVGSVRADTRALLERFTGEGTDFTRFRHRLRLSASSPFAPYGGGEYFFDASGWRSFRMSGGLRWKATSRFELDAGYFFEPRRTSLGPDRHMFMTSLHLRLKPGKPADPDI